MSNKKGSSVSLIIFGLLFVALGIFLFVIQSGVSLVMLIAGIDAVFGVALIFAGIVSGGSRNNNADDNDAWSDAAQEEPVRSEPVEETAPARFVRRAPERERVEEASSAPTDASGLAVREGELRVAAKRAAEDAAQAKAVATAAVKEAKQAEAELRQAENELAQLPPSEQRSAMRRIDILAQRAAEKAEVAVEESKRAKQAISKAREAAELHSLAMDAAADAMSGEDEFAEFN